jgi:hypothetical protein
MPTSPLQLAFCHPSLPSSLAFTVGSVSRQCGYWLPPRPDHSFWYGGKQLNHMGPFFMNESNQHGSNESQHDDIRRNMTMTDDPSLFFELMSPVHTAQPDQMSASSLAYLGDVLFELFIRSRYVWPERRMSDLQNKVVSIVRGKD